MSPAVLFHGIVFPSAKHCFPFRKALLSPPRNIAFPFAEHFFPPFRPVHF